MSGTTLNWAWEQEVPGHLKLMLVLLGDEAGSEDGVCWASYEHLARKTGGSRRNVIRQVGALEKRGLVQIVTVPGGANAFVVQCPACPALGDLSRMETKRRRRLLERSDNLSPQAERGDTQGLETPAGGDADDTPEQPEGVTPVTPGSDAGGTPGVTPRAERGDTLVTQTPIDPPEDPPPDPGAPDGAGAQAGQPIWDNGPKWPRADDEPWKWLSCDVAAMRFKEAEDRDYNPWQEKVLAQCKRILADLAQHGGLAEARRRLGNLVRWHRMEGDFYHITVGDLQAKWPKLHAPPQGYQGRRGAMAMAPPDDRPPVMAGVIQGGEA